MQQAAPLALPPPGQWQSDADLPIRRQVTEKISEIFNKRKGGVQSTKLSDFMRRLEDGLYRNARSMEEYTNEVTLEVRLQEVARRYVRAGGSSQSSQQQAYGQQDGSRGGTNDSGQGVGAGPSGAGPGSNALGPPGPMGGGFVPTPSGYGGPSGGGGMHGGSMLNGGGPMVGGINGMGMGMGMGDMASMGHGAQAAPNIWGSNNISGATVMGNGAPVMIKGAGGHESYGSSVYANGGNQSGMGAMGGPSPNLLPSQSPQPGFVPTSSTGGMVPNGGMAHGSPPGGGMGMVPSSSSPGNMGGGMGPGMVPNPGMGSGMVPNPGMGSGMVPNQGMGMASSSGMVPQQMMHGGGGGWSNGVGGQHMASGPVGPGMVPMGGGGGSMPSGSGMGSGMGTGGGGGMGAGMGPGGGGGGGAQMQMPGQAGQPGGGGSVSSDVGEQASMSKQQRWLLFLRHCAKCKQSEHECSLKAQCKFGKQLWNHILNCADSACQFPRCVNSKELLKHHQKCMDQRCAVCVPVKEYVKRSRQASAQQAMMHSGQPGQHQQQQHAGQQAQHQGHMGMGQIHGQGSGMVPTPGQGGGTQQQMQQAQAQAQAIAAQQQARMQQMAQMQAMQQQQQQQHMAPSGPGGKKRQMGGFAGDGTNMGSLGFAGGMVPNIGGAGSGHAGGSQGADAHHAKRARHDETLISKNTGTSLLETFTADLIRTHCETIRAASAADRQLVPPGTAPNDICRVCGLVRILYEPPVVFCMSCGQKIKRGQTFYSTPESSVADIKGAWCHACFTDTKPDKILLEGSNYKKADLLKKKNENEDDEAWVGCDNCEGWVHQICGMFNKGRNNQDVHYLCPECLVTGVETGQRQRIEVRPQAMLDAKELPINRLSAFLETHMAGAIEQERRQRAQALGVEPHAVPGAEGLSVRVVNNIIKKCETKQKYYEAFSQTDGYPTGFPYRQRVILLFQKIEGVDVCLFVMYVQEYGADCSAPNTNVVYLSYLDSIRYFRPDGVMASGCPNPNTQLRTFVYHQLQVAYLAYVKRLGFEKMFIWACPPMAGDDYILYCHPSKQKTPRSDRLRLWYVDMLKDARARGIVMHMSTLWDTYFDGGKDHRLDRISSTYIPYLEGDYWPGEAENLLGLMADSDRGGKGGKKDSPALSGAASGSRKGGSKGKRYGGGVGGTSTDEQLMSRLGDILGGNMKEDFIVVHLKEVCTFCRIHIEGGSGCFKLHSAAPMKSGGRTFDGVKIEGGPSMPSGTVTTLTVCESCYQDEQRRFEQRGAHVRLPAGVTPDKLSYVKLEEDVPRMQEEDPMMECEHFGTRQAFLNLCQGNHYQFDTLRRAKHSSMMVLYHLHNPDAPAFSVSCNVCTAEMESGAGFRCTVCQDFDICQKCSVNPGHPHPLTRHVQRLDETRMRLTEGERKERSEQLQRTMALLVHACSCNNPLCASNSCRKVRQLFHHAMHCQVKVTGGCQTCKKIWCLLNLHAKSCTQPDCPVPRCRELKEIRRRQASRQEEQRRVAYQAMLRAQMASQS
ncbi:hypothetical protein FOA52_003439 [Chlamydomonas sp. UWO 241]|nr:hypothetical protein FOA52_003439 [Chlamydomonas sp. UWO 241]